MANQRLLLLLASGSPRRQEILSSLSIPFKVVKPKNVNETPFPNESPRRLVQRLSLLKAKAVSELYPKHLVLAADTIVFKNKKIYGKPNNLAEARAMLLSLQGSRHDVYTGVALVWGQKQVKFSDFEVTKVFFKKIARLELEAYLKTKEPYDKAGGYAIQGTAARWIKKWEGDYFSVVGLPIQWVLQKLNSLGF